MNSYLFSFGISLINSLVFTVAVREFAKRHGWMDRPDSARKLHKVATPRVGGVAIYLSMVVSLGLVCLLPTGVAAAFTENIGGVVKIVGLSGLMMAIGLWDDLTDLSPWKKFSAQVVLALLCWTLGFRILESWTSTGTTFSVGLLSLPLTVIWIVGITNAFNIIDGMDGLSAGAALFAMISMLVVSFSNHQPSTILLLAALAGATLGFLKYNFNPASIFLGDSGSLMLGFTLALLAVKNSQKSTTAFSIAVPIVAFGLPVLDTAMAILRRFLSGKPILSADRRHIHHILIERGLNPKNAVILLYGICGLFGLFSLLFVNPSGKIVGFALAVLGACVWLGIQQLKYPELREANAYLSRGLKNQRKLIAGNVAVGKMKDGIRHAPGLEELLNCLASALDELSFSRCDLRLPVTALDSEGLAAKQWNRFPKGEDYVLLRWNSPCAKCRTAKGKRAVSTRRAQPSAKHTMRISQRGRISTESKVSSCGDCRVIRDSEFGEERLAAFKGVNPDFKLEFEFRLPVSGEAHKTNRGLETGAVTFYHPTLTQYPVSAITMLSQNMGVEFEKAFHRIMSAKTEFVSEVAWKGSFAGSASPLGATEPL